MKKLLLLLLMIPTISFAEYDSKYYKDWIEGECIEQSYIAKNDFVAKKIFNRCEKASKKCIAKAKKQETTSTDIKICKEGGMEYESCIDYLLQSAKSKTYKKCVRNETGWKGKNSPKF